MIRGKQPEADLRLRYRRNLGIAFALSLLLHGFVFVLFPDIEPKVHAQSEEPVIIQLEDIPPTRQERQPPPPSRPVVPVATDSPEVPDDLTIEETNIDFSFLDDLPPPPPRVRRQQETVVQEIELEEDEEEIVELWKVEKQPVVTKQVVPDYPEIALRANITGRVFVTALITTEGRVERLGEITGPEVFHQAAREAALQWEFEPAIQNDRPVKVWVSLPFTFRLD